MGVFQSLAVTRVTLWEYGSKRDAEDPSDFTASVFAA